jgi:hypothetical protein
MFHTAELSFTKILYIIFGILYFLYSSRRKKKNIRSGEQEDNADTPRSKSPLEEMMEAFKGYDAKPAREQQKAESTPASSTKETLVYKPLSGYKPIRKKNLTSENAIGRTKPVGIERKIGDTTVVEEVEEVLINGVLARDAIVASEILNRPYA